MESQSKDMPNVCGHRTIDGPSNWADRKSQKSRRPSLSPSSGMVEKVRVAIVSMVNDLQRVVPGRLEFQNFASLTKGLNRPSRWLLTRDAISE